MQDEQRAKKAAIELTEGEVLFFYWLMQMAKTEFGRPLDQDDERLRDKWEFEFRRILADYFPDTYKELIK